MTVLAFDVYGTLIDTNGVVDALHKYMGDKASDFAKTWRDKQLEYSFRRGLMNSYEPFSTCISESLDYCCEFYQVSLQANEKQQLLELYLQLPKFNDVDDCLAELTITDHKLYAFSNGHPNAIKALLKNSNIREHFIDIISVDVLKTFKPNPSVYQYFIQTTHSADNACLISSNPFDVIGAISAGMKAVWVKRKQEMVFDPWGIEPTKTIKSLGELKQALIEI